MLRPFGVARWTGLRFEQPLLHLLLNLITGHRSPPHTHSALLKLFGQLTPGSKQPDFDRPLGTVQHAGDLGQRQFLMVIHHKTGSVFLSKILQCSLQLFTQVVCEIVRVGMWQPLILDMVKEINRCLSARPVCQCRSAAIDRDLGQPRPKGSTGVPARKAPKGPQENFLHEVFGVVSMPNQPVTQSKQQALISFHQRPHRNGIAIETLLNELSVVGCQRECPEAIIGRLPDDRRGRLASAFRATHVRQPAFQRKIPASAG
jgi:hypothetical protein